MRPIAFFDFDGTITRHDTLISFGRFALGRLRFAFCVALALPYIALWKTGFVSNSRAKEKLFGLLFGKMELSRFNALGEAFVPIIDKDLRHSTMDLIKSHQAKGDRTVIVSASIANWIEPWAMANGFERVIATEAEIDDNGRLTGRFATPNCHGEEKARRIVDVLGDISQTETFAYGDSAGDEAMLNLSTHSRLIY